MAPTNPGTFVRRVHQARVEWTHAAIVGQLLTDRSLGLRELTCTGLVAAGVIVPVEIARRRLAERVATEVLRDEVLRQDVDQWLTELATESAFAIRVDGVNELMNPDHEEFLARLAACLGVDAPRAIRAWLALHAQSPAHVNALRAFLPATWADVALGAVESSSSASLAGEAVRRVILTVGPLR